MCKIEKKKWVKKFLFYYQMRKIEMLAETNNASQKVMGFSGSLLHFFFFTDLYQKLIVHKLEVFFR